jgi:hypothetical protein
VFADQPIGIQKKLSDEKLNTSTMRGVLLPPGVLGASPNGLLYQSGAKLISSRSRLGIPSDESWARISTSNSPGQGQHSESGRN